MTSIGKFLLYICVTIGLGACTLLETREEKGEMAESQTAISMEANSPDDVATPSECEISNSVKFVGGSGNTSNLTLGDELIISGTDNIFYASAGACLLKRGSCLEKMGDGAVMISQYYVVSCDDAPSKGCLVDLQGGNRVVYTTTCQSS